MTQRIDQERHFFDREYARFLDLPSHELRIDKQIFLRTIRDPRQPAYERRLLFERAAEELCRTPLAGLRVLDYGCGTGDFGLWMAAEGAYVTLLDLSPVAIQLVLRRAEAGGVLDRVRGIARDATDLSCLKDGEFDLVFGSAALHHTLKYPGAVEELARVCRRGARLVLAEPWGGNPWLNRLRRLRARLSDEPPEQGEEIIFGPQHIALLAPYFRDFHVVHLNLLAMGKRLLRGRFHHAHVRAALALLEAADRILLAAIPVLRSWCGEAVICAVRR